MAIARRKWLFWIPRCTYLERSGSAARPKIVPCLNADLFKWTLLQSHRQFSWFLQLHFSLFIFIYKIYFASTWHDLTWLEKYTHRSLTIKLFLYANDIFSANKSCYSFLHYVCIEFNLNRPVTKGNSQTINLVPSYLAPLSSNKK